MNGIVKEIVPVSGGYYPIIQTDCGKILKGMSENISEVLTVNGTMPEPGMKVFFTTDGGPIYDGALCAWRLI